MAIQSSPDSGRLGNSLATELLMTGSVMDTIVRSLTPDQHERVLTAVHSAVSTAYPLAEAQARPVGGSETLDTHLDALVNIVRCSTARTIEPYSAQILDDVCAKCTHQTVSGYCPQRAAGPCVVYRFGGPIVTAIQGVLHQIGDEEFIARRG